MYHNSFGGDWSQPGPKFSPGSRGHQQHLRGSHGNSQRWGFFFYRLPRWVAKDHYHSLSNITKVGSNPDFSPRFLFPYLIMCRGRSLMAYISNPWQCQLFDVNVGKNRNPGYSRYILVNEFMSSISTGQEVEFQSSTVLHVAILNQEA